MTIPNPTRLFHMTAISNLEAIIQSGSLLCKNRGLTNGIAYQNIAHAGAQGARATKHVPDPPGGTIHDYVPFYFAPRSPMLYAINAGNVQGCDIRQADILYFETSVQNVAGASLEFVFYDHNATLSFSKPYTDVMHLKHVAWELICESPSLDGYCKYFHNVNANPRLAARTEKRQAEFLVKNAFPLTLVSRIGVINEAKKHQVQAILARSGLTLTVDVMPEWYFLGQ